MQVDSMGAPFEHSPLPGQLVLLARPPSEDQGDSDQGFALRVPHEAILPLLRALRRSLETTKAEVNGDRALWSTLFERFGAGGNDLVAPSECSLCGEGCEALRVRLAAAEARLAAASLRHDEELQELRQALSPKPGRVEEAPQRSPPSLSRPPRTARTPPRPPLSGFARPQESLPVPPVEQEPPLQNFSLSAEFWRLREALAREEANEHQQTSGTEVQRLRTALAATTAKLERYEASSVEDSQRVVISLADRLAAVTGAQAGRKPELLSQVEPDTARTVVAGPETLAEGHEQSSPGKHRPSQLGGYSAVIRPLARTSTSLVSPARLSPALAARSSSPGGPRRTVAELTSAPPQRPVQLSPNPARPSSAGCTATIQAASPPRPPGRISGSASARLPQAMPGQAPAPAMRVYNVVRSVHTPPQSQAAIRVISSVQGTASAVQWTTPRPGGDRAVTPITGMVQRVSPPPVAAVRKTATISRTGSMSPPPMVTRREATSPPMVTMQNRMSAAQFMELSV